MNYKDEQIKIQLPNMAEMSAHKRRLKVALLTHHERLSKIHLFTRFIIDLKNNMLLGKKSTAIATVAIFGLILTAGIMGPTASDVAQAEAINTVNRAFARFINLSEEEKTNLQEQFQDRVHFKEPGDMQFHRMNELTLEEKEAQHEKIKASLVDSLAEAQASEDLQVISADEMPKPGFIGKAGRAFGFKMMRSNSNNLKNLPEEMKIKIQENQEIHAEMEPVKFLKYTNKEGQVVTLGVNANDEPVMKFIEGEDNMFQGRGEKGGPMPGFWKENESID